MQPLPADEVRSLLHLKAGEAYREADAALTLQSLYATGRYYDIVIEADQTAGAEATVGELAVRILTTRNWFTGRVTVEGAKDPPSGAQIANATRLTLGEEFTAGQVTQSTQNIESLLRSNGFFEAKVRPEVSTRPEIEQVDVRFVLEPGHRARFSMPEIQGTTQRTPEQVADATGWERFWGLAGWKTVNESRVQGGLRNVQKSFEKQGFLLADISLEAMTYKPESRTAVPSLRIDEGVPVDLRTTGVKIRSGRLRTLVPIYQENTADRELLQEGANNIAGYLQANGFFDATVQFTSRTRDGRRLIEYEIDRGERYRLAAIDIRGNNYFDFATIRERLLIQPATILRYRNGRFSERLLESSRAAVAVLYRSNGFRDVKVETVVEDNYEGKPRQQAVSFRITEGNQWFVGALAVEGVPPEEEEFLRSQLQSIPGQPFSEQTVATDRDALLSTFYNNGYLAASFDWARTPGTDPYTVDLRYILKPGRRDFVRLVLVDGLDTTNPSIVYRRLNLLPGSPLSQSRMLEGQRRLYDLGIFSRVEMAVQNPLGIEASKYVLYQLEEARRYGVDFGVGAEVGRIGGGINSFESPAGTTGFSPRVYLALNRYNMFGLGHTASVQTRVSNFLQRAVVTYLAPQFRDSESFSLAFTTLIESSRNVRTFDATRIEGAIQLSQRLSLPSTGIYRFTLRRVAVREDSLKIQPELIPRAAQPVRVGIASGLFIQDRRDNPINPTRGYYNSVDFGVATRGFSSQSDFIRLLGRNSSYQKLRKDIVFARVTTFGLLHAFSADPRRDVPLPERFFSGGANTLRGFPENQAGPRDLATGFPVGGKALLINSTELRFPLIGDSLGAVAFHDAGNVYSSLGNISFRYKQPSLANFDYMTQTLGVGLRYATPIGPVRVDVGYTQNASRFFGFVGTREELLFGQGRRELTGINRFQFHFSLGQTF